MKGFDVGLSAITAGSIQRLTVGSTQNAEKINQILFTSENKNGLSKSTLDALDCPEPGTFMGILNSMSGCVNFLS